MAQRIHLYCLCWNEAAILPYFFRHYGPLVDRFFVYDNGSTDGTLPMLRGDPRVHVEMFAREGDSFVEQECRLSDAIWQQSRGAADWVILLDIDEHIHHPDLRAYLESATQGGVTAIRSVGYEMVADDFPTASTRLSQQITRGVRSPGHDKLCVFAPDAIAQTNFGPGRRGAAPSGRVVWPSRSEVTMLHYKHLGLPYVVERNAMLRRGLGEGDLRMRWGRQYLRTQPEVAATLAWLSSLAAPVPGLAGSNKLAGEVWDDEDTLRQCGLFLADWYVGSNPDVAAAGVDPLVHYHAVGWREGRRPNPHFDPTWYAATYPEAVATTEPLVDYVRIGERIGRRPSPLFDPVAYRSMHVVREPENALLHYVRGLRHHRGPGPLGGRAPAPVAVGAQ